MKSVRWEGTTAFPVGGAPHSAVEWHPVPEVPVKRGHGPLNVSELNRESNQARNRPSGCERLCRRGRFDHLVGAIARNHAHAVTWHLSSVQLETREVDDGDEGRRYGIFPLYAQVPPLLSSTRWTHGAPASSIGSLEMLWSRLVADDGGTPCRIFDTWNKDD